MEIVLKFEFDAFGLSYHWLVLEKNPFSSEIQNFIEEIASHGIRMYNQHKNI